MYKPASIIALALLILAACGPRQTSEESATTIALDLNVEVNHQRMIVSWKKHGTGAISGYNVYIEQQPLVERYPGPMSGRDAQSFNREPFPGDTNPDDGVEYFEAEGLENGVPYYVSIRVVHPDGTLSKPTREVKAVCGGRGTLNLPVRFAAKPDGFSFEKNDYVEADALDNDLIFLAKDGADILMSASRLGGFAHETRFAVLKQRGELDQVAAALREAPVTPENDRISIAEGDWLLAQTHDGAYALLKLKSFSGSGKSRRIELFYAYSALASEILF